MSLQWQCNVCTYYHQFPNKKCVMCSSPRTNDATIQMSIHSQNENIGEMQYHVSKSSSLLRRKQRRKSEGDVQWLKIGNNSEETNVIDLTKSMSVAITPSSRDKLSCSSRRGYDKSPSPLSCNEKVLELNNISVIDCPSTSNSVPKIDQPKNRSRFLLRPSQSAYLQHLAEICATILHDERWKGVISWEHGDDLSAAVALARFEEDTTTEKEKQDPPLQEYEEEARAMLLYSRMFIRKGPWFRMDDLLKYYSDPNKLVSFDDAKNHDADKIIGHDVDSSRDEEASLLSEVLSESSNEKLNSLCSSNDALKSLFQDVHYLLSKGLIRTFSGEHECGIVVGNPKAASGIFTCDERNALLQKLGCRSHKRNPRNLKLGNNDSNEILAQMMSQRPLFFPTSTSPKAGNGDQKKECILLPIRCHVDKIIKDSILCKIGIHESNSTDALEKKIAWDFVDSPPLCIRLSEQPLQCVRRCARLFLIAGGGPGSMREGCQSVREPPIKPANINHPLQSPPLWNTALFPGLQQRLKLKAFLFQNDYQKLRQGGSSQIDCCDRKVSPKAIFHGGVYQFRCWELSCELRSQVTYLLEKNQIIESAKRRDKKRRLSSGSLAEAVSFEPDYLEDDLQLLNDEGKEKLIRELLQGCIFSDETVEHIVCQINLTLSELSEAKTCNKAQDMVLVITVVIRNLLRARLSFLPLADVTRYVLHPWLRHLQIEAILANCLWDMVEICEKCGCYALAIDSLMIITGLSIPSKVIGHTPSNTELDSSRQAFVQLLLSRRSRGKALERLVIDHVHLLRQEAKGLRNSIRKPKVESNVLVDAEADLSGTQKLCFHLLEKVGIDSSVPFSAYRALAKRLKRPLAEIISQIPNSEASELQLRLDNGENTDKPRKSTKQSKKNQKDDSDIGCGWRPTTDISVANSIKSGENGSRCAFVGWEESADVTSSPKLHRSLNVEELALEEYASGRLPNHNSTPIEGPHGGWIGWHDEGGHIRALFRILSTDQLLGSKAVLGESFSLYLTPYQNSPLDLHVAAQGLQAVPRDSGINNFVSSTKGFYFQRKTAIDAFLKAIEQLSQDDLCDIVYETIKKKVLECKLTSDSNLMKDVSELRKLSLIAAGIGGKLLSAIFRCLCYDYRHYCAGLPDLILSRAFYDDSDRAAVDLVDWVGEAIDFSTASQTTSILFDRDDEFLGCSKNDSFAPSTSWGRKVNSAQPKAIHPGASTDDVLEMLPKKLQLLHNDRRVKVQCMFVEVKSSNDRLDGRQQDWLNVLDNFGMARVCKFESTDKK